MAAAKGLDLRENPVQRPDADRHGIGVVEKQRVGTDGFHIPREILHYRNGSQRAENAAYARAQKEGRRFFIPLPG